MKDLKIFLVTPAAITGLDQLKICPKMTFLATFSLLTQDDDLLASISRGRVVRDVHDLQFLLGLGIIDWSGAHWG